MYLFICYLKDRKVVTDRNMGEIFHPLVHAPDFPTTAEAEPVGSHESGTQSGFPRSMAQNQVLVPLPATSQDILGKQSQVLQDR